MREWIGASAIAAALSWGMVCGAAHAGAIALGARAGTLGLGAEGTVGLTDRLNLRVPVNAFSYGYDETDDGIKYDGRLKLGSLGAQLDVHPFKGSFYLTAGLFANRNKVKLKASDPSGTEEYELGDEDTVYTSDPDDPLALHGGLKFDDVAPYVGLGWGNAIQGKSSFYFRFEIGAYFEGSAKVGMRASGSAVDGETGESFSVDDDSAEAQAFRQNLEEERAKLEHDIKKYDIYPAVGLALGYRFRL